ncbi:MAG: phenylalanine--tRNA ligase subunit beta [Gudongella sp.]|nr:phenylalanine--tRNA ligase subunit beta [Gudongella sp.]
MLLPINWLKSYLDIDITPKDLADGLTYSGSHVESITSMERGIKNIVIGKVVEIDKHPDADKLFITKIDIGEEPLTIVTGAKNLKKGDFVPVAKIGSRLANGVEIGATEFRGVQSEGMLCSLGELGFLDNVIAKEFRDGIFVFDRDYPLGDDVKEYLQMTDDVIEFEITPNRPDCLSIYGMARETAATFNRDLRDIKPKLKNEQDDIHNFTNGIELQTPYCARYYSRVIKDVVIAPSPLWLQTTLMNAGVRPINNIVDITNYVMLELGQPLHAFDLDNLSGKKIIVRQANNKETLTTLDKTQRILDENDIVIADATDSIGLAGIMGGLDSEITPSTKTVLLEGANFSEKHIRLTSKKLLLRTEASTRFEKGLDPNLCEQAVERVAELVEQTCSGVVVNGVIDIKQYENKNKIIGLRPQRVEMLLGVEIPVSDMHTYLNRLGFMTSTVDNNIKVIVPSFRNDVEVEADLIEEIGRLYGFHNIVSKPLVGVLTRGEKSYKKQIESRVKNIIQGLGFNEVMTYSFVSPKSYDRLNLNENASERTFIKLMNPLGEDFSTMRTTLVSNMLDLIERNQKRGVIAANFYEIGHVFIPKSLPVIELPDEKNILSIGFYGDNDFYFMKESIEIILDRLGIKDINFIRESNNPTYHPGRTAIVLSGDIKLGILGETHPDVLINYDIKQRVYIADIDFDKIVELSDLDIKYNPLPKFPSMTRDIAIVVDEDVMIGELENIIKFHGKDLIESIDLFDIYRGDQVPENKKSVAFSIVYRSFEETLRDEKINPIQEAIISDLEKKFNAVLRS